MFAIKEFPYRRPLDTIFKPLVSYAIVNQFLVQTLNVLMVFQSNFSRAFKTKYKKIQNNQKSKVLSYQSTQHN